MKKFIRKWLFKWCFSKRERIVIVNSLYRRCRDLSTDSVPGDDEIRYMANILGNEFLREKF